MSTAAVIDTGDSSFTNAKTTSSDQGAQVMGSVNPSFSGHLGPVRAFKMRAWDTVANAYVHWTSVGDPTTPPPTLNPVTGTTAMLATRSRTV